MDYTKLSNTQLDPEQEVKFRKWASEQQKLSDLYNYDLRGFYKDNQELSDDGHGSDLYKKPNHPTFSNESQYSVPGAEGGKWNPNPDQSNYFEPSTLNTIMHSPEELQQYFKEVEPDVQLRFPNLREKLR